MSLSFDLTAIPLETRTIVAERDGNRAMGEDFKKGDRIMSPVTNALIWQCLAVGMRGITEDNRMEFYTRVKMYEKLFGPALSYSDKRGARPFTYADIVEHTGLSTNVSPEKRVSWLTSVMKQFERHAESDKARYEREHSSEHLAAVAAIRETGAELDAED